MTKFEKHLNRVKSPTGRRCVMLAAVPLFAVIVVVCATIDAAVAAKDATDEIVKSYREAWKAAGRD
jgi:hypothetical protein